MCGSAVCRLTVLLTVFALFTSLLPAHAGDKTNSDLPWAEGFDLPGFDGEVKAMCEFQGCMFVGGQFRTYGSVDADNLIYFDGSQWRGFEESFGVAVGQITCLTVYQDRLVIAGDVSVTEGGVNSQHIVTFDGAQLHGLQSGFSGRPAALLVHDGQLIAGGDLWYNGDRTQTFKHLARWTGTSWAAYGSGMSSPVQALCEYEGDLIVGGRFTTANGVVVNGITRWNGGYFSPISDWTGTGYANVKALAVYGGKLYAGGDFSSIEDHPADRLAAWDGQHWAEVGHGITSSDNTCFVQCLKDVDGKLLVGGRFQQAGPLATHGAVLWDGEEFVDMAGGVEKPGYDGGVNDAAAWDGGWWLGGWFTRAGGQVAHYLAVWDGTGWRDAPLTEGAGLEGTVTALCLWNGELIAGGRFTAAGSTLAEHIARWDGTSWQPLGAGLDAEVTAFCVRDGDLIAAGEFSTAGGQAASHIARWDGAAWHTLDGGLDRAPETMAVYLDDLYVGGDQTSAGGQPAANLSVWDGATWTGVPGGVDGVVRSLLVVGEDLLVGGDFATIGGVAANHLASWNGTAWAEYAGGADGPVHALAWYDGVVAGGQFMNLGDAAVGVTPCSRVGRWNDGHWQQLGLGFLDEECWEVGPDDWDCWDVFVTDMTVCAGRLFVNGITRSGDLPLRSLACWTEDEHWTPLGSGLSNPYTLCAEGTRLWVGGGMTPMVDDPGYCLAAWDIDLIPTGDDELWWSGFDSQGVDLEANSLAEFDGKLVAAGRFTDAGGVAVGNVAVWNGQNWAPLGVGFGPFGLNYPRVQKLLEWKGSLYAAGLFSLPPSTDYVSLARWTGTVWEPLMAGVYAKYVNDLVPWGDDLMLIGNFPEVNGQPAGGLAVFDGATVSPVPVEVTGDQYGGYLVGGLVYDEDLVVFGDFQAIDGIALHNVARWDGESWLPDADGFTVSGEVRCALLDAGKLYVGGSITWAGSNSAHGVACWDGAAWDRLEGGVTRASGYTPQVEAMTVVEGKLTVGGFFDQAAGAACSQGLAQWNGSAWNSLGSGFILNYSYNVYDMCTWNEDLYIAGRFNLIGDKNAGNIARRLTVALVDAPLPVLRAGAYLQPAYPNPFNGRTTLRFKVATPGRVQLAVYDTRGRLVRRLLDEPRPAGSYQMNWDGRNERGADMPSGVYLVRLRTGGEVRSGKLVYVR